LSTYKITTKDRFYIVDQKTKGGKKMVKITQEMKDIIEKTRGWAFATSTKDGMPNVVPIHFVKLISDNEIMFVDIFMKKTLENIKNNPNVALTVWDWDVKPRKGYQFKGQARIETSGKLFEEGIKIVKAEKPDLDPKGIVIVKVKSIYITSPGPDAGKEVIQ
jgi:predicted pyridoxine 5'-phosphate oxidase superfamily flavin-nucleotide-binding protein